MNQTDATTTSNGDPIEGDAKEPNSDPQATHPESFSARELSDDLSSEYVTPPLEDYHAYSTILQEAARDTQRALLASLFANAEDEEELNTIYETAYRAGLYPDLVDEARELAEAATITAEPDGGGE